MTKKTTKIGTTTAAAPTAMGSIALLGNNGTYFAVQGPATELPVPGTTVRGLFGLPGEYQVVTVGGAQAVPVEVGAPVGVKGVAEKTLGPRFSNLTATAIQYGLANGLAALNAQRKLAGKGPINANKWTALAARFRAHSAVAAPAADAQPVMN